jgi:hypothetical protein
MSEKMNEAIMAGREEVRDGGRIRSGFVYLKI